MSKVVTYKARVGNALPVLGRSTSTRELIFYSFGAELQEVIACTGVTELVQSADMCLQGGQYFSAQYKAYPGKVNGKLKFTAVFTKKPVLTLQYSSNGSGNSSLASDF